MMGLVKPGLLPADGIGLRDPTRPVVTGGLGLGIVIVLAGDITLITDEEIGSLLDSLVPVGSLADGSSTFPATADDEILELLRAEFASPFLWVESSRAYLTTLTAEGLQVLAVTDFTFDPTTGQVTPNLAVGDASAPQVIDDGTGTMTADDGSPIG